ncbi:carboxypeptidase-like regulatory domain-containing protein [Saccharicrinis sp. FJH62]|uniref:carboxypeptidase-like regulatory domain-containing protein n=1 Tax=Saccharicrinis sp. FJH62 TaxID=3344657 RepID=UPI0035D426DF
MKSRFRRADLILKTLTIFIITTLFTNSLTLAQETETTDFNFEKTEEKEIKGKIVNEYNGEGIPFANIVIENTLTGTSTDDDGNFSLKYPVDLENNNIFISVIGFSSKRFKLSELEKVENVIIQLKPINYEIISINIEAESKVLYGYVRKTIKNVGETFITGPFDYNFKYKNTYIAGNLNRVTESQGIITDDSGYIQQTPPELFKSRTYTFSNTTRNYRVKPYKTGITNMDELLKYDIVRSHTSIFSDANLYQYRLELMDSEPYDGDTLLHIAFKNLEPDLITTQDAYIKYYEGELYILKNAGVLIKCVIKGSSTKKSVLGKSYYVKGNNDLFGEDIRYVATIMYHNQGDKYHLSSINLNETFVTENKLKGKSVTQLIIPDHKMLDHKPSIGIRDFYNNPDGY